MARNFIIERNPEPDSNPVGTAFAYGIWAYDTNDPDSGEIVEGAPTIEAAQKRLKTLPDILEKAGYWDGGQS